MCKHCFFACLWSACDASRWFAHKPLAPNRPAAAPRTVSPGARPRRSPGGAGGARARPHRTLLERPAAGPPSRPTAPRRRAAEAPASPARIRGPMAGSRRLGGGGGFDARRQFGLAFPSHFLPARTRGPGTGPARAGLCLPDGGRLPRYGSSASKSRLRPWSGLVSAPWSALVSTRART